MSETILFYTTNNNFKKRKKYFKNRQIITNWISLHSAKILIGRRKTASTIFHFLIPFGCL